MGLISPAEVLRTLCSNPVVPEAAAPKPSLRQGERRSLPPAPLHLALPSVVEMRPATLPHGEAVVEGAGTGLAKVECMKRSILFLPIILTLLSCDQDEPIPLREDSVYRHPSKPGERQEVPQAVPQGAQATGDAETRTGDGVAGGETPTAGDHVGAGSQASGNPSGAPTAGGSGRPDKEQ
jgi:hypothetical protein